LLQNNNLLKEKKKLICNQQMRQILHNRQRSR
jgi:hypothetical protein